MNTKRKIEVFSAGCPVCEDVVNLINQLACPSCEVTIHAMTDIHVAERARKLGVKSVPAVVINGELASCCAGSGINEHTLRAMGLGQA